MKDLKDKLMMNSSHSSTSSTTITATDNKIPSLPHQSQEEECPLCLEPLDFSELGFNPCPCGYKICRFCYFHIK